MKSIKTLFSGTSSSFIAIPIFILSLLAMIILPLPPFLLDGFFTFNIVLSMMVLLVSLSIRRPLDFSIFPTVLLIATLLRLCMNVASTRVVLQFGHESPDAAGKVVEAFGKVVIGGNYVVGMVVFLILVIINFIVITKGSERISEVAARFTLDALPGKQMAIDADLNAGMIDQRQAKDRRDEIALEADFYGSMDGASKFVKGDAIAGLLILFINLFGGVAIGVFQHGLGFSEAMGVYSLLSIGDGLVAQIPSLMLAVSAAIVVTRVSDSDDDITTQLRDQLLASPPVIMTAAMVMLVLGLVPGMPTLAFLSFAALLGWAAWKNRVFKVKKVDPADLERLEQFTRPTENALAWGDIPYIDMIKLELGYQLVYLADRDKGAELLQRLRGVRQTLSEQAGFLLPEVRVKDNMGLKPNQYAIYLHGSKMAVGDLMVDRLMAINSGELLGEVHGFLTKEPVYGMDAVWIQPSDKAKALNLGYSVVDAATIIGTHISKIIRGNVAALLQLDDVHSMQQRLGQIAPKLSEELNSKLTANQQLKVYRYLLTDQVSLVDLRSIAQSMVDGAEVIKDPIMLAAEVRSSLRHTILHGLIGNASTVQVFTLSDELENMLLNALTQSQRNGSVPIDSFPIEPQLLSQLQNRMPSIKEQMSLQGWSPILLVLPQLRPLLARYARTFAKGLHVLSFNEVPDDHHIEVKGILG
ncbi:flagellar biosynthesis protein FlhA [Aeromonas aquatica]|uniref:flagellar biosynthesis protein FlhA n=1 Tax=Aeromonas aquatica TaxID=558964 RepID=UPI00286F341A|nr:flagellar biosynthesis protein FlhA [Aeromonas aquatica]